LRHLQPTQSLEGVLEDLQAAAATYAPGQRQLAAVRYYLQCMLGECESLWEREAAQGITNYKSLLDQIERFRKPTESVCLVTFNYDSMLERALVAVGIRVASLEDYVSSDAYKLIKLHGSVNWGRLVSLPGMDNSNLMGRDDWTLANELIDHASELQVTDAYRFQYQRPMVKASGSPLIPALAIPLQKKQNYECPSEHLDALKKALPSVRRLLVIGWRAADRPFLELLRRDGRQAVDCLVVAGVRSKPRRSWRTCATGASTPITGRPESAALRISYSNVAQTRCSGARALGSRQRRRKARKVLRGTID
jgi:hypothetical protein